MRIIASTKRNLLEKIAEGTFRQDLYYRLDVLRINIPPLARAAGGRAAAGRAPARSGSPASGRCQLEPAAVGRAPAARLAGQCPRVVPCPGAGLPGRRRPRSPPSCWRPRSAAADPTPAAAAMRRFPGRHRPAENATCLQEALRTAGGNKTAAAAALGMKPSTFRDKLAKHGLG